MAYARTPLPLVAALALAGLVACGGSDQNTQPQTPSNTNTTTTTGASGMNAGAPTGASTQPSTSYPSTDTSNQGTSTAMGTSGMSSTSGSPTEATAGTTPSSGTGMAASAGSTGTSETTLTDAQIAAVTETANAGEIEQAREALKKAKNARVKQFAQHMVTDHGQAQTKQKDIDKKQGITPQENDASNQLKSGGVQIMSTLKSSSGADFDKAYIDAQVNEHQQLLDMLDNKLIPQAQNADLKSMLQQVRTKVSDHLKMAKDIQASLAK